VAALVLEYYLLLRSVLRSKTQLRECLSRCRHCRIFFLTHPCNGGRQDLGCPFGCQEAYRKQQSTRRSTDYYRDSKGKKKKSALNNKRRRCPARKEEAPKTAADMVPQPQVASKGWNGPIVEHVRMVASLIEERWVSREEILSMLERKMRQHSLGRRGKIGYMLRRLNANPP
jgi:hypothetical protein